MYSSISILMFINNTQKTLLREIMRECLHAREISFKR